MLTASLAASLLAGCAGSPKAPVSISDGPADKADSTGDLSAAQAKATLTAIDDACTDAWCEGDFDFRFSKIQCHFATQSCTLTAQIAPLADAPQDEVWYWRSCKMSGLDNAAALLDAHGSIQSGFWSALDGCVNKLESSLPSGGSPKCNFDQQTGCSQSQWCVPTDSSLTAATCQSVKNTSVCRSNSECTGGAVCAYPTAFVDAGLCVPPAPTTNDFSGLACGGMSGRTCPSDYVCISVLDVPGANGSCQKPGQ
jgi:hypothetical protein